jgi:branched-chain amino acid transport system ATP-binding protein
MLEILDLEVAYGRVRAVQGLSLRVEQGEVVGMIGPNGAGKTTTLSAVFGLVRPERGSVTFQGRSLLGLAPEAIAARGLSLVPEGRQIFGTLSVQENLDLGATLRSDKRAVRQDLEKLLERFPVLGRYRNTPASRLSGGEQQQLAVARALLNNPTLLLLDEPSLGLAPMVVDQIFEVLDELRQQGTSILLVEQQAARTLAFADRTYLVRSGRLLASGTSAELEAELDLTRAYLGGA